MRNYVFGQFAQVFQTDHDRTPWVIAFGALWTYLNQHFEGFALSNPVFWVSMFWAMDWIFGSILAFKRSNWSPKRSFYGVLKWFIWMAVLAVAWGVRSSQFFGCELIASCIEVAILLTEGTSVLRNCAELSENQRIRRLIHRFADATERKLEQLEERLAAAEKLTASLPPTEVQPATIVPETQATASGEKPLDTPN